MTDAARAASLLEVLDGAGAVGGRAAVRSLTQLEGGWSRQSWAASVEDREAGSLELIVRVQQSGSLLETDLRQEYETYRALAGEPIPVPTVRGMCDDPDNPFGGPFFAMDRLPGRSPNVWRGRDRKELAKDWEDGRGYANDLVDTLVAIHEVPVERLEGVVVARDFAAIVEHWRGVQHEMAIVEDPIIEEAYVWAAEREPPPREPRLVHGDYRIGNCLIEAGHITGVLDWELAFLGDPRFDLGYVGLDYHAGKFTRPGSKLLNAVADRDWFRERYEAASGGAVDEEVVRTFAVLGTLALCAILTTGLHEYAVGNTEDIRMAWTRFALPGLRQDMIRMMQW